MADRRLDPDAPPGLHLISAILVMESAGSVLSLARECGGGKVTGEVQKFIWDHCFNKADGKIHAPYLKNLLKKLIASVESDHGDVLDELYEEYASYITSLKGDNLVKDNARVCKCISFLFPNDPPTFSHSRKLVASLQCSLNMLEGDTGCSIWPSSLYLSELILSFPDLFSGKLCFEVGSGVGLVGICLAHVKASKIILSDGDLSTLANLKLNLSMNQSKTEANMPETNTEENVVKCIHLPWESASESELEDFVPDVVLGADIIYDPSCLPHLVRVLTILLKRSKTCAGKHKESHQRSSPDVKANDAIKGEAFHGLGTSEFYANENGLGSNIPDPVAYIACVIRNMETFSYFLALVDQANLRIRDLTDTLKPSNLLPYLHTYERQSIRLYIVSCK